MIGRLNVSGEVIGGSGGASTWEDLQDKPFDTVGAGLKVTGGILQEAVPVYSETTTEGAGWYLGYPTDVEMEASYPIPVVGVEALQAIGNEFGIYVYDHDRMIRRQCMTYTNSERAGWDSDGNYYGFVWPSFSETDTRVTIYHDDPETVRFLISSVSAGTEITFTNFTQQQCLDLGLNYTRGIEVAVNHKLPGYLVEIDDSTIKNDVSNNRLYVDREALDIPDGLPSLEYQPQGEYSVKGIADGYGSGYYELEQIPSMDSLNAGTYTLASVKDAGGYISKEWVEVGGGSGSSVQPDWNQNNSSADDYVKNRTHYQYEAIEQQWTQNDFDDTYCTFSSNASVWSSDVASIAETVVNRTNLSVRFTYNWDDGNGNTMTVDDGFTINAYEDIWNGLSFTGDSMGYTYSVWLSLDEYDNEQFHINCEEPGFFTSFNVLTLGRYDDVAVTRYSKLDSNYINTDNETVRVIDGQLHAFPSIWDSYSGDGNYVLKANVSDGNVYYYWELDNNT